MSHSTLRRCITIILLAAGLCLLPVTGHALWLQPEGPQTATEPTVAEAPATGTQPGLLTWLVDAFSAVFGNASSTDTSSPDPTTTSPTGEGTTTDGGSTDDGDGGSGLDPAGG